MIPVTEDRDILRQSEQMLSPARSSTKAPFGPALGKASYQDNASTAVHRFVPEVTRDTQERAMTTTYKTQVVGTFRGLLPRGGSR